MSYWESPGRSDEYFTPKYLFDAMGCHFDMDVASPVDRQFCSVPANTFITERSLEVEWMGFVWMNPPFGGRNGLTPWVSKMIDHNNGIALTPDRTSAPWWQIAAQPAKAILFVNGKIKFVKSDGRTANSPSNGTTLFAYGQKGLLALLRASENGLGILLT